MSDLDPTQLKHAAESAPGLWNVLVTGLAGATATVAGLMFKDVNKRVKGVELSYIDIIEKLSEKATKQDIKDIHHKIENLSRENTDRIIKIIEGQKGK